MEEKKEEQEAQMQDLVDELVEGYITQDEFRTGLKKLQMREYVLYEQSVEKWSAREHVDWTIEEMAELTLALCKSKRPDVPHTPSIINVCEEIADVQIMLETLQIMFGKNTVENFKRQKLERLVRRLEPETEVSE